MMEYYLDFQTKNQDFGNGMYNKGVECEPPQMTEWGGKSFRLVDPCGNELEFLVAM